MELFMLTDYRGFFRQGLKKKSMDKKKLVKEFNKKNIQIKEYKFEEIINSNISLKDEIIIYTSSKDLKYKKYIDDILYYLSKNNTIIPRYEIFKAHSDKGYQEIIKKDLGINSLNSYYFGNLDGFTSLKNKKLNFPLVLKKNNGAGSSNVFKVSSETEIKKFVKKINRLKNISLNTIKRYAKKYIFSKKYGDDVYNGGYILQDFVSGLNSDWKILIFDKKYYILNRKTRHNDFRASGSGKFSYIDPPKEVLNYAKRIYKKLDVPFISLDLVFDGKGCHVIEFQCVHFGPYTLVNSPWHYEYSNENWNKINKESVLEEEYVNSYIKYIENNFI